MPPKQGEAAEAASSFTKAEAHTIHVVGECLGYKYSQAAMDRLGPARLIAFEVRGLLRGAAHRAAEQRSCATEGFWVRYPDMVDRFTKLAQESERQAEEYGKLFEKICTLPEAEIYLERYRYGAKYAVHCELDYTATPGLRALIRANYHGSHLA